MLLIESIVIAVFHINCSRIRSMRRTEVNPVARTIQSSGGVPPDAGGCQVQSSLHTRVFFIIPYLLLFFNDKQRLVFCRSFQLSLSRRALENRQESSGASDPCFTADRNLTTTFDSAGRQDPWMQASCVFSMELSKLLVLDDFQFRFF